MIVVPAVGVGLRHDVLLKRTKVRSRCRQRMLDAVDMGITSADAGVILDD
jgi:hypothetical protein